MATERDVTSRADARAHRRWIIGIAITVVFGVFGAVMALLAYTKMEPGPAMSQPGRSGAARPGAKPAVVAPAATGAPPTPAAPAAETAVEPPHDRGKGHGRE